MLVQSKECVNFIDFAVWEGTSIMSKHDLWILLEASHIKQFNTH